MPPSNYMIPGLYFYDNSVVEVARVDRARAPVASWRSARSTAATWREGRLEVCKLPFSTEWFDVGTFDALLDAQTWVGGQQRRKGLLIGAPETAAHREGFITADQLRALAAAADQGEDLTKSGYGEHLLRFLEFEAGHRRLMARSSTSPSSRHRHRRPVPHHHEAGHRRARHRPRVLPGVGLRGRRAAVARPVAPGQRHRDRARAALRGMHGEDMDKLVAVVAGEAFGAYVDLRPTSAHARRRSSRPRSCPGDAGARAARRGQRLPGHSRPA